MNVTLLTDKRLRERWARVQAAGDAGDLRAFRRALPSLLTESAKTIKSLKVEALTGILYMSPYREAGYLVCPLASAGCIKACLGHTSGRMAMTVNGGLGDHKRARILRTWAFFAYRKLFLEALRAEIRALQARAERKGMRAFVRLNGTSDLPWENFGLFEEFPDVQFYDYTKIPPRAMAWGRGLMARNYHLTFSRSETNDSDCLDVLRAGGNVAIVFRSRLPATWKGFEVTDGDETDARPDDTRGVWVGLKAKGPVAKRDNTGFVVREESVT